MMVRYSVSSESLDDRSRLSPDCTEPGGGEIVLPRRTAGLSCRRQEICLAGLASRGIRKSDAYAGKIRGVCGRVHSETAWKLRTDKNAETSRKTPCGGAPPSTDAKRG